MSTWILFIIAAAVIVVCGVQLSKHGDIIAEKTGLGRAWTGLILMAGITSLPELVTGISSVTIAQVPEIAAGDIMGSSVVNLMILALLDPMEKGKSIFSRIGQSHLLSAGFGIALIGIASLSIILKGFMPSFGHIGVYTPVIIAVYLLGIRLVYSYEKRFIGELVEEAAEKRLYEEVTLRSAVLLYSMNALIVTIVATALPFIARNIAESTGLGGGFIGTVMVAATTSLPELVVSVSAVRFGAPDLATGNILGSNMFNILILAVDDILYRKGPLLSAVSVSHAVTGITAIVMTAIVLISITYRPKNEGRFGLDSILMLLMGGLNMYAVYLLRNR